MDILPTETLRHWYLFTLLLFITRKYTIINANLKLIGKIFLNTHALVIEILLTLMYSTMVLMVVCWRYRMPLDANGGVSTLVNIN